MVSPKRRTQETPPTDGKLHKNVNQAERIASAVGGGLLALWGVQRLTVPRMAVLLTGGFLAYRGATGSCPVFKQIGLDTSTDGEPAELNIEQSVTVARPRDEVYGFWRDFNNLPRFMRHLASVEDLGERRSRWVARVPKGVGTISWEAEITDEDEGQLLSWKSVPGSDVHNAGTVRFNDLAGDRVGTEVHVNISYRPPGAEVGKLVTSLLNPVNQQFIKEDIRRFKQLLEAGEIPTTEGQPAAR